MQLATLLVCLFALFSDEQFINTRAQRDGGRFIASSSLAEIETHIMRDPNPFLLYYSAKKYEEFGYLEKARRNYECALEMMDLPSAILLLDEAGDETDFGKEIYKKIMTIKMDRGALRIPFLANYFLYRGFLRDNKGLDPERSIRFSIEMDPFQIPARLALINHYLRHTNPLLYNELVGLFHSFRDFSNQYALLINLYFFTSTAVAVSFFLYLIGLFIRHARSIYHGFLSLFPRWIPYYLRLGLVALIILIPILIGLGSLWLWLGLALVVAIFCNFREKTVLMVGSVLLLMTPIFSTLELKLVEVGDAFLLYRAQVSPWNSELVDSLYAVKQERTSYPLLFSIGLLEKKGGRFEAAEQAYMEALKENPESSAVHNNLGNVFFNTGRIEDAVAEYERAIELNPNLASAHYNLSQAYLKLMIFDKYTQEIETANSLDFELVTRFLNTSSEHPNRMVIDETLSKRVLWHEIFASQGKRLISPILRLGNSLLVLAGCILIVSLILVGRVVRLTQSYCSVCRAPVCDKCARMVEQEVVCNSCASKMELTKSPGVQQKIAQRIKAKKNRLKKIVSSLLSVFPGLGHIYIGAIYKGFFLLLVSVYISVGIICNGIPYRLETLAVVLPVLRLILAIAFLLLVSLAVFDILKRKRKLV